MEQPDGAALAGRNSPAAVRMAATRVEKPWGRRSLPPPFAAEGDALAAPVGEIWFELPGLPLDLMVKYIFTAEKLSIQVHPDDEQARADGHRHGKDECWYILHAEPGAMVGIGTLAPLDPARLAESCQSGEIESLLAWVPVNAGDFFNIPAGTIHAIGAGIVLVEIQQNADITYRLYDYGRARELHLERGLAAAKPAPCRRDLRGLPDGGQAGVLVDGPKFRLALARGEVPELAGTGPYYIVPLAGSVETAAGSAGPGECLLTSDPASIVPAADARLFVARGCGDGAEPVLAG